MLFSIDEHELCLDGLSREHLDLDRNDLSEAELSVSIIDYERNIRESCVYDPAFSRKITDLCNNYSLDELESALSLSSSDVFAARNDLERFISVNIGMDGELPPELQSQLAEYQAVLESAIVRNEMLKTAIGLKQTENIESKSGF